MSSTSAPNSRFARRPVVARLWLAALTTALIWIGGAQAHGADNPSADDSAADAFRAHVTGLPPPSPDPRNFEGVYVPEPAYQGAVRAAPRPIAPADTPALANDQARVTGSVQCRPAVHFAARGRSMMPDEIVQSGSEMVLINEEDHAFREVFINGRHPTALAPQPSGHSIGRWVGNVLVIDTVGFTRQGGFSGQETLRLTEATHLTERLEKIDGGRLLKHTVTIDDPSQYRQPYTFEFAERYRPDVHLFENICEEGYRRYKIIDGHVLNPNTSDDAQ